MMAISALRPPKRAMEGNFGGDDRWGALRTRNFRQRIAILIASNQDLAVGTVVDARRSHDADLEPQP